MKKKKANVQLNESFGLAIRKLRHKANISQEQLAEKATIHRTYLSAIESGKVNISLAIANNLATATDKHLSKIIFSLEKNTSEQVKTSNDRCS